MSDTPALGAALAATAAVLDHLDERLRLVNEREAAIQRSLEVCHNERASLIKERETMVAAAELYRRYQRPLETAPARQESDSHSGALPMLPGQASSSIPGFRARVGPQRYRILAHLRAAVSPVTIDDICTATDLSRSRVRKQVAADIRDGFVAGGEGGLTITHKGLELMERFETYKRSHGEPLPPLSGPSGDDEDSASAENSEDAEGADGREETATQQTEDPMA